jgi:hypothetical protein
MRLPTVEYVYGDPEHPDRPTSAIHSPAYTREDRALLMGLESYEASLCRCGVPVQVAWHSEMDGYFEADQVVCHVCTARAGRQVPYSTNLRSTRDPALPMPAFVPGKTITAPDKGP